MLARYNSVVCNNNKKIKCNKSSIYIYIFFTNSYVFKKVISYKSMIFEVKHTHKHTHICDDYQRSRYYLCKYTINRL